MGKVILSMSMSLDGFIAGPKTGVELPMGEGGLRLHDWLLESTSEVDAAVAQEVSATTGAALLGRRMFEVGVGVWEDTPYPVPCFVLTHEPRALLQMKSGSFTFVTDLGSALSQAKAAAEDKNVIIMGANLAQQCLKAGLIDTVQIQLVPILLGQGLRLFEHLGDEPIELERTQMLESPSVTHLRYRVLVEQRSLPNDRREE